MNYYEHHISDYQRKTAHLSLAEHGAYLLMLQTFYASERPLPGDRKVLFRLLRADTKVEKAAVESVIRQFWRISAEGLTNGRADSVVTEYHAWVEKQKANGKRGGRPAKSEGLTQMKPNGGDSHLDLDLNHDLDLRPPTSQAAPPMGSGGGGGGNKKRLRTADEIEAEERTNALG